MNIYLIRHGMTMGNEKKVYTGSSNVGLSKRGIMELNDLKDWYKCLDGIDVYTSKLKRTFETKNILFPNSKHIDSLEFMNETNFGEFEGKSYTDLYQDKNYIAWINDIQNVIPKGGESFKHFKKRVLDNFKNHIKELNEDTIYVTHGGVIRIIMSSFVNPEIPFFDWEIKNGKGYVIRMDNGIIKEYKQL